MEQAEAATRAKSTFIANMSHELRTPLNAVIGYAQLMARGAHDPETSLNLDRILRSSEHLLGLINDVLSISKIEAGRLTLNLEAFSTNTFFRDIENMIRLRAQFKGLSFHMDIDPSMPFAVLGDAQKLRQVLVNLLGNAVKFTETGTVSLQVNRDKDRTCFCVLDTGIGIEAEKLEQIFKPFEQLGITANHAEGTGLGLHISQTIVQLMGGKIEVRSEPGKGSSFHFGIPLPDAGMEAVPHPLPRVLGLSTGQALPKQLVVDDVEDSRCLLRDIFETMGLEVDTACNGLEALTNWEAAEPQVVWMDLMMPTMDGWNAARTIRAREEQLGRGRTILIALTASVINLNTDDLTKVGFDDWILKPFQESTLFQKLEKHLGLKFEFEAASKTIESQDEIDPSRLNAMDPAWFQSFRQALVLGDTQEMLALTEQLQDPNLTRGLRSHISEYRYEELKRLLDMGEQHA
jgi:two-component system, sensor histidine kinase and response regulator